MQKNLLISLFLVLITLFAKAQSISISSAESSNNYCIGSLLTVRYFSLGTYKTGNKFRIQARPSNAIVWQDLPTNEPSIGILTANIPTLNASNGNTYYYFRVVSSDPVINSDYNSFTIYDVPNLQITGTSTNGSTNINPFDPVSLINSLVSGVYPYAVTFSDSSVIQVNSSSELKLFPEKSGTYSVVKVSNVCGIGKGTGSVNVTVNSVPLKIVNIPGNYLCSDGTYTITYSSSATFEKDNKFKVRIKKDLQNKEYFDVDATVMQDGIISYKITDNVPIGTYQGYQLVSSNPAAVSSFLQQYIEVSAKPSVEVISASTTINYGQKIAVQLASTGRGPFNALMSDGKRLGSDSYNYQSIDISPEKNTQYFVESFSAACGSGVGKNKMAITVKSGVKIDSIPDSRYCTEAKVRVRIKANYVLNASDKYVIRMKSNSGNNTTMDVNATLVNGNFLEFNVPAGVEDKLGIRSVGLAVVVNGVENVYTTDIPANPYYSNALKILEKPRAYLNDYYSPTFTKPSVSNLSVVVRGGGNFITELSDGNKYVYNESSDYGGYSYPFVEVFTQKTTIYSLKSISNECGPGTITQSNLQTVSITTNQANFVYLKSSNLINKPSYCVGEKIKFDISSEGNFDNSNEWKFEIVQQNSSQATTFLASKEKSSELTLPDITVAGNYKIRVYSTNPLVYSNYIYIFIKKKPNVSFNSYGIYNNGEKISGSIYLSGGAPYEVGFSDNTKKTVGKEGSINAYENNDAYFERENLPPGTFELKSISNACGVGSVDANSAKINILGSSYYNINIVQESFSSGGILCYPLNLTFSVNFNIPKSSEIPYSVQISASNDTSFVNLATAQKGNRFSIILPDKYKSSNYKIRVVSEDALKIKSNLFYIQTGANLSETAISLNNSTKVNESTINGGNQAAIYFQNIGDNIFYVIKDNFNRIYTGNAYSYFNALNVVPLKTTTYTLKSVTSACGYNKSSGIVKIIVKPTVSAALKTSNNANFCPSAEVAVNLSSFGDFEKDNVFKTYMYKSGDTTTIREVATTNVIENYSFKVPNDLTRGNYTLRIKSSSPVSSKDFAYVGISGLPEVTLSGGSVINAGSNGYLTFTLKDAVYEELEYELSDKTIGRSGNTYNNNGKYFIPVTPKVTTTYTLNSIKNQCGLGKFEGSATIEVNPPSDKQVNLDFQNFYYTVFCTGSTVSVPFTTKGTFSATNVFTVQMSDAQGKNFKDLKTEGTKSPLTAIVPVNSSAGGSYLFRVVASDKDATSTTTQYGSVAYIGPTARFDTASYYFSEGKPVKINIKFTGTAPYYFIVGTDEISAKQFNSYKPVYELILNPTTPTKFKLFSVSDSYCGRGAVIEPSTVNLELITANETFEEMQIQLFPNPTSDIIYIKSDGKKAELELVDITGISIFQKPIKTEQEELNISQIKAGTYFLRVSKNDKQAVFKVVKL